MLSINWTGMHKTYWIPVFKRKVAGELWFLEVKFLFLQISLYSVELGKAMIDRCNEPRITRHADPDKALSAN